MVKGTSRNINRVTRSRGQTGGSRRQRVTCPRKIDTEPAERGYAIDRIHRSCTR